MASCELFADSGEVVMADIFFPTEDFTQLKLYANGGGVKLIKGTAYGIMRAVK